MAKSGVTSPDRDLAAEVRRMTLKKIKKLFELESFSDKERELHDAILLRLAGTVLPRLTEVTGEDGEPIKLAFDNAFNQIANVQPTPQTTGDSPQSEPVQDSPSGS